MHRLAQPLHYLTRLQATARKAATCLCPSPIPTFGPDHRLRYARGVQPKIINGQKCLVLDAALRDENPAAYEYVLAFAKANQLRIHEANAAGESG
jgi:hypothetical protein